MNAWKKVLDPKNYSTEQKEYFEVVAFFAFLLLAAIVGIIKIIFWECKSGVGKLFTKVIEKKKESSR